MRKRVAVVGGGASGLMTAILVAESGADVTLFEQNSRVAKKILVSGNGRCNISNTHLSANDYFGENPSFVSYALEAFGFIAFEKFCNSIGLLLTTLEDGRAYPLSNEAKSVAKIFEEYALSLGVVFHKEERVTNIAPLLKKYDSVVIATGSRAAEHLGGNADAEHFAMAYGHSIVPAYPSLVQLHLKESIVKKMSGTKIEAAVTLYVNAQKEQTIQGDVLFTNYGLSGFAILDISQSASEALQGYQAVDISLNLLPHFTMQKLASHIVKVAAAHSTFTLLDILVGLLPQKIAQALLETLQIKLTTPASECHTKLTKRIANQILNWRFEVVDTHGFRHAEVSGGGVNTLEIDEKTMMSKREKNLYFVGEAVDVVGRRGGYNFAWAWASSYLAAKDICR